MVATVHRLKKNIVRIGLTAMLVGLMSFVLAACGAEATPIPPTTPPATPTTADTGGGSAQEVNLTLKEWAIEPKGPSVNAGKVKFVATNEGQFTHNAVILLDADGKEIGRTPNFGKSDSPKTIEVDLQPGEYTLLCDIPGHAENGMITSLTVK